VSFVEAYLSIWQNYQIYQFGKTIKYIKLAKKEGYLFFAAQIPGKGVNLSGRGNHPRIQNKIYGDDS